MMSLLIRDHHRSPGKDFDVFLEPLIEDLLELWTSVDAYVVIITSKIFKLLAIVLWCTHDYLALSTLSRHTTKGYFACIIGTTILFPMA